jgi:hypothetical protein
MTETGPGRRVSDQDEPAAGRSTRRNHQIVGHLTDCMKPGEVGTKRATRVTISESGFQPGAGRQDAKGN